MDTSTVSCKQTYPIGHHILWEIVKDFYSDWHPAMKWCKKEAKQVRYFATHNGHEYREQLTDYSVTDCTYSYTMLEGIENLESYKASLSVVKGDIPNHSDLIWQAEICADNANAIAEGTKAIFEQGIHKIKEIVVEKQLVSQLLALPKQIILVQDTGGLGEVCLFLHGIGGNRSNWSNQVIALSQYCRAIAVDIRGYGDSDLNNQGITTDIISKDILKIMNYARVDKIHLVGLSFGSWLAASFADTYPEKVTSLTLCAGSTGMSEARQEEIDGFSKARLEPTQRGTTPADIADAVVEQISGPHTTPDTKALLHKCMTDLPRETYLAALTCFLNPPKKIDFESFNFPTLFIAGEHDKLASPKEMQGVAARVPNSQFVEIKKAGHLINLDCPEDYNTTLTNFLKEVMA